MSRRAHLALSAAATAFVSVLVGGVATYALRPHSASSSQASAGIPVGVVNAREAEYRRLIDEANARLRARRTDRDTVPKAAKPVARHGRPAEREEDEGPSREASGGDEEGREDGDG